MSERVAVVGGGIAGLAAAHALLERGAEVTVLEAGARFGGRIGSREVDGCLLESGPDGFFAGTPSLERLIERIGLAAEVVEAEPGWAGIVAGGRTLRLPMHLWNGVPYRPREILGCRILTPRERLRLLAEPWLGRRAADPFAVIAPESLDGLLRRRLGEGATRKLVGPLLAGVHAGAAGELEAVSVAPALVAGEVESGSLLRAARMATKAARGPTAADRGESNRRPLRSLRRGMGQLVEAMVTQLTAGGARLRLLTRVRAVSRSGPEWFLEVAGQAAQGPFDRVVLAVPAAELARLLRRTAPQAAELAAEVTTTDGRLAHLVGDSPLPGRYRRLHGAIVPPAVTGPISAFSVPSIKWPGRSPAGPLLIRASLRPGADATEAGRAVSDLLGLEAPLRVLDAEESPGAWPAMALGHAERVGRLRREIGALAGLGIVGAAWDGVGLGALVAAGERVAGEGPAGGPGA